MKYPIITLFTGAGGLDLGLEMAGFQTCVATELEEYACETLRQAKIFGNAKGKAFDAFIQQATTQRCYSLASDDEKKSLTARLHDTSRKPYLVHAEIIQGDIRNITSSDLYDKCSLAKGEDLALVAGGPPCQPFSRAGKRQAVDDIKNGDLFFEFVRVVNDLKPRWFLFENVKGLILTKTDILRINCTACGHSDIVPFKVRMAWGLGESVDFNCPSCKSEKVKVANTEKVGGSLDIILREFERIGYKCYNTVLNAANFGVPQMRERLFIVGSRDGKDFEWPKTTHFTTKVNGSNHHPELPLFSSKGENSMSPWVSMYDALWADGHYKYGKLNKKKAVLWVKNVVRPHAEPVTWALDRPSPTIGAHQSAKLALAPFGVPDEQLARQQWHSKGKRQGDTEPIHFEHAYLTDEELLLLQTFPRWWYLHGTRMQRAFQIGNAVPPRLAKFVGSAILAADKKGYKKK